MDLMGTSNSGQQTDQPTDIATYRAAIAAKKGYFAGASHNILQQWTYASQKKAVADSDDPVSTSYTEVVYIFSLRYKIL